MPDAWFAIQQPSRKELFNNSMKMKNKWKNKVVKRIRVK